MSESLPDYSFVVEDINIRVTRLSDGLGFGDGQISRFDRESMPGNEDLAEVTDNALRNPAILVPVGRYDSGELIDDDGCIDGRPVAESLGAIIRGVQILKTSLHRPKVPGGGLVMTAASRIGLGLAAGQSLTDTFEAARQQAKNANVKVGGHTDDHAQAHGPNCGCGALDKAVDNIAAVGLYRPQISQVVEILAGNSPELAATKQHSDVRPGILEHYVELAEAGSRAAGFAGRAIMNNLIDSEAVVKQLAGPHRETRIAINRVPGLTIDQAVVRDGTGDRAQVFALDEWKLQALAKDLYSDPAEQRRAYLSQLVYTLGVTAVLTKGDLPIDLYEAA